MRTINSIFKTMFALALLSSVLVSCEKEDEEDELHIMFKTTAGYTFADATLAADSAIVIGIESETEKAKDPIIRFNISESVNGGANSTIYTEDMEAATYEHDQSFVMDSVSGSVHVYTFTITNRDGKIKQASLTLTVQ